MGFLKFFSKSGAAVQRLPSGSMTVDRNGRLVTSTVSSTYPAEMLNEIATQVLRLFEEARDAQLPLASFNLHFASLQISAREMRGGAMIFLTPKNFSTRPQNENAL